VSISTTLRSSFRWPMASRRPTKPPVDDPQKWQGADPVASMTPTASLTRSSSPYAVRALLLRP